MPQQYQASSLAPVFGQATAGSTSLFGGTGLGAQPPQPQVEAVQLPSHEPEEIFEEIVLPDGSTTSEAEVSTSVTETPFAISYSVEGKSTIPSDGIEHQVAVAVLPFQSSTSYVTVPRIDPRLFLQVRPQPLHIMTLLNTFCSAKSKTPANTDSFLVL